MAFSDDMTAKLFVGGLAGITTSDDLHQLFSPIGKLKLGIYILRLRR